MNNNFKVYRDLNLDSLKVTQDLQVRESEISCPSSNYTSSKIYNDGTYDNVTIAGVLAVCGADITSAATDEQWDAYRQSATNISAASYQQSLAANTVWRSNSDETTIPNYIAMFTKGLSHDAAGRVVPSQYNQLRTALVNRDITALAAVPIAGTRKFVQPLGSLTLDLLGPAASALSLPAAPKMSSAESAAEMVEDYCHVLCRDVAFVDYSTDLTVADCITYMNSLSDYRGATPVTAGNIFRGIGDGDTNGPYLSQIFFLDDVMWPYNITAPIDFPTRSSTNNRMITSVNYLAVQNGTVPESGPTLSGTPTYPSTGRDGSYCVWQDVLAQWYLTASKRLLDAGAPFNPLNPYLNTPLNNNQDPFITWSLIDLLVCLNITAQSALTCAWYAKWIINRRLRPEEFGNEVEQYRLTGLNPAHIHSDLLTNGVLADILAAQGNYYLAQTYPEGSPMHPSYPAGHAVLSGACATVIKAFLDETWVFPSPVVPNSAGTVLVATGDTLLLGQEVNKLASNIALSRNWAGVHYRSDGHEGILLGEKYAIQVLQNWINRYPESDAQFSFHGYMGDLITIQPQTSFATQVQNAS